MRTKALLLVALMVTMSLSGCLTNEEIVEQIIVEEVESPRTFVTDKTGLKIFIFINAMIFAFITFVTNTPFMVKMQSENIFSMFY